MKKRLLLVLSLVAVFVCLFAISVSAADEIDGIYYKLTVTNAEEKIGTAEVTIDNAKMCTLTDVVIPSTVKKDGITYTVTTIADHAFSGQPWGSNTTIKSLYIPETVSYIGEHILREVKSIETVVIKAKGAENIALPNANFYNCSNLKSVDLSDSNVSAFTKHVFFGCSSLSDLKLPPRITKIGTETFKGCSSLTGTLDLSSYTFTAIESWAFNGCSKLEKIIFPSTLTSIGGNCIQGTTSLKSLVLPDGFNSLANDAIAQITLDVVIFPTLNAENSIHNESFHGVGVKALIYEGTNYEVLNGEGKLFAGYTAKPFSEYVPGTTYSKIIFYGATLCSKCNGILGEESFHFTDYTSEFSKGKLCSHCAKVDTTQESDAMFTFVGFSIPENGDAGFVVKYTVNNEAIALYKTLTGKDVAFGLYAATEDKLEGGDIFDEEGMPNEGALKAEVGSGFMILELKVAGFTTEEQKAEKLALGVYVETTFEETKEYSFLNQKTPLEGDKYFFVSYNDVLDLVK